MRMCALQVIIWQFDRIVEGFLPKVHDALTKHGVNSEYYAIQWLLGSAGLEPLSVFEHVATKVPLPLCQRLATKGGAPDLG